MQGHEITLPEVILIAGTRAALGAGIALLVADKLTPEQRRAIGGTLVGVGALSTIPLAMELKTKVTEPSHDDHDAWLHA